MSKIDPEYVPFTELSENIVDLTTEGKTTVAHWKLQFNKGRVEVPPATLYRINEIVLANSTCDVGHIQNRHLWYVILGTKVLWSSIPITTNPIIKDPNKKKKSKKPRFNRYTALINN